MSTSPIVREATHAGSWYSSSQLKLNAELNEYFSSQGDIISGVRVIVGPHAGYYYAGETLSKAYRALDLSDIKRVFILGPSHHVYFKGYVYTSGCSIYETPLGDVPVDTELINQLVKSNLFKKMSLQIDQDEHSFEMHMPFLYKLGKESGHVPKIVPIMVSATNEEFEHNLAETLKPFFIDKSNAFIISTDFCHWGRRFDYMAYTPTGEVEDLLSKPKKVNEGLPIYKSIEKLDHLGMQMVSTGSYRKFKDYIYDTGNTICGAKPLSILLSVMSDFQTTDGSTKMKWVGYHQSSHVKDSTDSSVSYAAGYCII